MLDYTILNQPVWGGDESNTIERIVKALPHYDLDLLDIVSHMDHERQMCTISEFTFTVCKFLMNVNISYNIDGSPEYAEGDYYIKFGFKREAKDLVIGIIVKYNGNDGYLSKYMQGVPFLLAFKINMEDYEFIKTYLLIKCMKSEDRYKYLDKVFKRLYGISR